MAVGASAGAARGAGAALAAGLVALLAYHGCARGSTPPPPPPATGPSSGAPAPTPPSGPAPATATALAPARRVIEGRFATAPACAACHGNAAAASAMRDASGREVAPHDLWRASMMASSARDPLWRAAVSAEVDATPSLRATIEAKCLHCHAPMASTEAALSGDPAPGADLLARDDARAQLALDGISCTLCHQVRPDDLGQDASYSGKFVIRDGKTIFGPHAFPFAAPMLQQTGFQPAQGAQLRDSALCGSCHTLFTDAHHADGTPAGARLPEQTPYLEWRNSIFSDEVASPGPEAASCQACHVPVVDADGRPISTEIARPPGAGAGGFPIQPRAPYGRHTFVGGNTLVPRLIRDDAARLNPTAGAAALDAMALLAREQLERRSARVTLLPATRAGDALLLSVRVENLTGHKLPTGLPIRRAWLRLRVRDAAGKTAFASGEHDTAGRILDGPAGAPLATELLGGPIEPHRTRISRQDEAQIYESVMAGPSGAAVFTLLRGVRYLKDDRLLPRGWSPGHPDAAHAAPAGVQGDPDFAAGGDIVLYEVHAPVAAGPFEVEVALLYQTLGARFAAELMSHATPEVAAFRRTYEAGDRTPVTLGSASARVP